MKYFLFFFLIVNSSYSQTGKITYSSIFNFGGGVKKTENNLYFTKNASLYQSQLKKDSKGKRDERTKENSENSKVVEINITVGTDSIGSLYYHNLNNRKTICREAIYNSRALKYYIYEDDATMKWQLVHEFKEISGFQCQKASTKFRGRNYEAWFTSEIPLSFGPWKFNGLPGLILEVYDHTGEVHFSADHIQIPFEAAEGKVQKPSGETIIEHREFIERANNEHSDLAQAVRARLPKGAKLVSTEVKTNGMELEYEWEKQ